MNKSKLPKDWIVVNSKNHPDRVYYFNVKTNKSSWEMPASNRTDQMSSKIERKSKRFKKVPAGKGPSETVPTTPDGKSCKNAEEECRSTRKRKFETKEISKMTESKETPQMQILREKIAQKKALAKSNLRTTAVTKSLPKPVNTEKVVVPLANETENDKTNSKTEAWTPQMVVIYEKMKQKSSKSGSTDKMSKLKKTAVSDGNAVVEKQDRVELRASRNRNTRSGRSANFLSTNNSTANDSTIVHTVTETDMDTECNVSKETFSEGTKEGETSTSTLRDGMSDAECESASQGLSEEVRLVKRPRISLKKNMAKHRLEVLRRSLASENKESESIVRNVSRSNRSLPTYSRNTESLLSLCKNVEVRLKHLHKQSPKKVLESNVRGSKRSANSDKSHSNPVTMVNRVAHERTEEIEYEEMDWEPMQDETITCEVQAVRTQLCTNRSTNTAQCLSGDTLESPFLSGQENKTLYIVIDTNVFLSNIEAVQRARDITFKHYGQPIIVIPWTVIRELDYIKDDKFDTRHESLRAKARKAVRFLNNHFASKHPRIIGQTAENVAKNKEKFAADCPDDEILQTCLQIRDLGKFVVLFSYDKNLSNKAMIYDIITLGRNDPLEKIDYFSAPNNRSEYLFNLCEKRKQGLESSLILKEELCMSNEVLEDTKTVVKDFLTVIITKEMQHLFGDKWESHTTIKPPWTVISALRCAIKHWIAAVSESFHRRAEPILKEILKTFTDIPEDGRRLRDVGHTLERCSDLIQMVNIDKHPELMIRASDKIDELRKRCLEYDTRINQKKLRDEIGVEDDAVEQERKAAKAFQYFELIYAYARDIGGMAAEVASMPCDFCYKIPNPAPTIEYLKQIQPEVAANVNRLLHVLSLALERLEKSCMDHRTLNSLYQVLTTFLPEIMTFNAELTPLDVYYCLKRKEQMLKEGLRQLQELSIHFCRLANYRST